MFHAVKVWIYNDIAVHYVQSDKTFEESLSPLCIRRVVLYNAPMCNTHMVGRISHRADKFK